MFLAVDGRVIDQDHLADIPLKFFILSRPEDWIERAFRRVNRSSLLQEFPLHDVAKADAQRDIERYLRSALSEIANARSYSQGSWPPEQELALLTRSDGLFIYTVTAICYIGARGVNFQRRLSEIVRLGPTPVIQGNTIDNLYLMVI